MAFHHGLQHPKFGGERALTHRIPATGRNGILQVTNLRKVEKMKRILIICTIINSLICQVTLQAQSWQTSAGINYTHFLSGGDYEAYGYARQLGPKLRLSAGIYDWKKRRVFSGIQLSYQSNACYIEESYSHHGYSSYERSSHRWQQLQLNFWPMGFRRMQKRLTMRFGYEITGIFHHRYSGSSSYTNYYYRPAIIDSVTNYENKKASVMMSPGMAISTSLLLIQKEHFKFGVQGYVGLNFLLPPIWGDFTSLYPLKFNLEAFASFPLYSLKKMELRQQQQARGKKERAERHQIRKNKRTIKRSSKSADISDQHWEFGFGVIAYRTQYFTLGHEIASHTRPGFEISMRRDQWMDRKKIPILGIQYINNVALLSERILVNQPSGFFDAYSIRRNWLGLTVIPIYASIFKKHLMLATGLQANALLLTRIHRTNAAAYFLPGHTNDPNFGIGHKGAIENFNLGILASASLVLVKRKDHNIKFRYSYIYFPFNDIHVNDTHSRSQRHEFALIFGFRKW